MEENDLNTNCKLLLIGGSAGSLEVLMTLLPELHIRPDFAIAIILHRKSAEDANLEHLIALKTMMPVAKVEDKISLQPGHIYVAPSDYHLLFEKNSQLSLDVSEKVQYSRPSIDVSFESAAAAFGPKCTAVLLSGANADGAVGLKAIQDAGGIVLVQNPETAKMPFMPQSAIALMKPNYIFDVQEIQNYINKIALR